MKLQYSSEEEKQALITEYVDIIGYKLACECNHVDGNFLIFESPTLYHTLDTETQEWLFDRDQWIDKEVRPKRNEILSASDYMMLYDNRSKLSFNDLKRWTDYRQALRDVPGNISTKINSPVDMVWPSLLVNENNITQES